MQALFGPITAIMVAGVATGFIEALKKLLKVDGWKAFFLAGLVAAFFTAPYHVFSSFMVAEAVTWPEIGMLVYEAVFYSATVWAMSVGFYHTGKKIFGNGNE